MAILPVSSDYTDLDFDALRSRIFSDIRSVFPAWSDTSIANFGNIIIEAFCFIGDVVTFYQNKQAREGRIATVELRKNMIALAKLIGYELGNATAASADLDFTITNASQLFGTVSASSTPVSVRTDDITDPISGEVASPPTFNIALGETTKTAGWIHQTTRPRYIAASTSRADQQLRLPYGPFLFDSEVITSTGDGSFSRVDNFLSSGPTSLHYRLEVDHNDLAIVTFGDGQNGKIPVGDIYVDYKTGGGVLGNVEAGSLKHLETAFVDSRGTRAIITVTNALPASGGEARETVDAARINAPASLRTLTRSVAREDFEINALRVAGVGRALMLTSNETALIGENRGQLYILPSSGGTASSVLLNQVRGVFGLEGQPSPLSNGAVYSPTVTFQLDVLSAVYQEVAVRVTVWVGNGYSAASVRSSIIDALEDFFSAMNADGTSNTDLDFGFNYKDADGNAVGEVAWSDVFNAIRDVAGVRKVAQDMQLNGAVDDVSIDLWKFPALGDVLIFNGDTGAEI
jgi:hypothetical protein